MKAITFLGAGNAYPIVYVMEDGREFTAPYFGAALSHFFADLDLCVLVTPEAREMHWDTFQELVSTETNSVSAVDIPGDGTEESLWQIFETVIDVVDEQDRVLFDITHGFRFLPFLSFLAAAYLRTIKGAQLEAVLYGNFEGRDRSVVPNRAPVIDMTRFVSLLDWMIGADRFIRFGDASDLAERLKAARPQRPAWPEQLTPDESAVSIRLNRAANALESVSNALRFIRPFEALDAADLLQTRLLDATQDLGQYARPFRPLAREVMRSYAPLALATPHNQGIGQQLARERELVHWYLERRQFAQALATTREWLVSWALAHVGLENQLAKKDRKQIEDSIGYDLQLRMKNPAVAQPSQYIDLHSLPNYASVVQLFGELGDMRNDVLHAAKRSGAMSAKTLSSKLPELCRQIDMLPLPAEPGSE